ncbi:hypothetical protein EV175_004765, partial [Coemansia sp. RSA 1933]
MSGNKKSGARETIIVIGAGIVGVSTAYFTAKRISEEYGDSSERPRVVLVEQSEAGSSASGKSGGFLARQWSDGTDTEQLAQFGYDLHARLAAEFNGAEQWGYRALDTYCAEIDRIPVRQAKQHKASNQRTDAEAAVTSIEVIAPRTHRVSPAATAQLRRTDGADGEDDDAQQLSTHASIPVPDVSAVKAVAPDTVPWLHTGVITKLHQVGSTATTAQVDPLKLVRVLLAEAKACGLETVRAKVIDICETGHRPPFIEIPVDKGRCNSGSPPDLLSMSGLSVAGREGGPNATRTDKPYIVLLDQGTDVPADKIVAACGAWATSCLRWEAFRDVSASQIPIQGLRVHYLLARPKTPLPAQAIFAEINGTVYSGEDAIEIYPRPDGSVFVCGEALDDPEMPPHNPFEPVYSKRATARLKQIVSDVSPALSFDVIQYGLACHLPVHARGIPVISK